MLVAYMPLYSIIIANSNITMVQRLNKKVNSSDLYILTITAFLKLPIWSEIIESIRSFEKGLLKINQIQ